MLFIIYPCILWLDSLWNQTIVFVLISVMFILILSVKKYYYELKMLLPFVTILMVLYLVFGLIGFAGSKTSLGMSPIEYWMLFALNRIILLFSTVYMIQVLISFCSVDDIIHLPLGMHRIKYFLLGKFLYCYAMRNITEIGFHIESIPSNQYTHKSIRGYMNKKLATILGLLILVMEEAEVEGELIDNRIRHCYFEEEK